MRNLVDSINLLMFRMCEANVCAYTIGLQLLLQFLAQHSCWFSFIYKLISTMRKLLRRLI